MSFKNKSKQDKTQTTVMSCVKDGWCGLVPWKFLIIFHGKQERLHFKTMY